MKWSLLFVCLFACGDSRPPDAPTTPASSVSVANVDNPNQQTTPPADPTPPLNPPPAASSSPSSSSMLPPQGGPVFDRGMAAAALGAVNVQACKRPHGVTGSGHVTVTFDPGSGQVSAASVDAGPFPGTPEGGCIAAQFRNAHVPPFSGAPVRVGKSFTLQ